jgi:hypothetical protein
MRYRLEFVSEYRDEENPYGSWCVYDTQDADYGLESFNSQDEARQYMVKMNRAVDAR